MTKLRKSAPVMALMFAMTVAGSSCRLDMHVQPKLKTLRGSTFWGDGRSARPLVPGTIARGELREDTYFYTGKINGQPANFMPFPVTKEVLERGQQRFNIYCSPCHSYIGDGNGMVVQRGFQHPPSYTEPRLLNAPIGHFYDVITHGFGKMQDYAAQVAPRDRWDIAAYIRALQLSQHAPLSMVPPGTQLADDSVILPSTSAPATQNQGTERK